MSRAVLRLVLDVVLTIALALLFLGGWQAILVGSVAGGFAEGFRVLVNFMDVGLAIWAILLIVFTVRASRQARPPTSAGRSYLYLLLGAILNLLVVLTVGFIQGGWAPLLVLFAIEAGVACLVAAAIVVPLVHRLVKPSAGVPVAT
jgi:hypothetical protein